MGPAFGVDRRLAQEFLAAGEGAEQLDVQVVAVGDDHDSRIPNGRLGNDPPCVESNGEVLVRPLGMPNHTDASVARLPSCRSWGLVTTNAVDYSFRPKSGSPQSLFHRHRHGVELGVAGDLLLQPAGRPQRR
jgi:hypothetical protein